MSNGTKVQILFFFLLALLFTSGFVMPLEPEGRAELAEKALTQAVDKANQQADKATQSAQTAQQQLDSLLSRIKDLNAALPSTNTTRSDLCPNSATRVAALLGGDPLKWVKLPGDDNGWAYNSKWSDNTTSFVAPEIGSLVNTSEGKKAPGQKTTTSVGRVFYYCN